MGRGGCNYDQLRAFRDDLARLAEEQEVFMESCAKELAARLLAKAIKRTPVGVYTSGSGKVGGTLRRGWTGGKSASGTAYAQSLKVHSFQGTYVIEITNPVDYASYVEFGHRTSSGGWVEGKHMLTISEAEIQRTAPAILERKLQKRLKELFS